MIRAHAPHEALRRPGRRRRHRLRGRARPRDRLPRPERRRQVHDHADDPRPRRADVRHGQRQRAPVRRLARAAARDRRPPRRARHPPRAVGPRPPAVDGGVQRHRRPPASARCSSWSASTRSRASGPGGSPSAWASGSASPRRMLGDPPVVVLDEPVNGLDPEGIRWVRTFARQLADEGRTVFISSHLMSEMALMADHLLVIGRGRDPGRLLDDGVHGRPRGVVRPREGAGARRRRRAARRPRARRAAGATTRSGSPASTPRRSGSCSSGTG